ncbi:MAG: class I SAM-dependent methyltransferase [Nitrososphaerales archaeon]
MSALGCSGLYYKGEKIDSSSTTPITDFHGYGSKIRSEILSRIPKKRHDLRVLDVGTGFGSTVAFLAERLPKRSKIWTVDPSQEILDNVKKTKFGADGANPFKAKVEFVQANAEKLGFEDNFFDSIVSVMVLHHLEDLGAVCSQLFRVLKKSGKLILADYRPEAGKKLDFQTRHLVSDFVRPEDVKKKLLRIGGFALVKTKSFKYWYIVEATK